MEPKYIIKGAVISGAKRGKTLGFPTANMKLSQKIPEGIYASEVIVDTRIYKAATFIGSPKTFGIKDYKLESYLLDFNQNLYGHQITVKLYKKIRSNQKFTSVGQLSKQIKKDISQIRHLFQTP